jgi:hypothetical protein
VIANTTIPPPSSISVANMRCLLPPTRPATTNAAVTAPAPKTPTM